jgi:dienelactone hydrolase
MSVSRRPKVMLGRRFVLLALAAGFVVSARAILFHARAAGVLLRLESPAEATPPSRWSLRGFDTSLLRESVISFGTRGGAARGRLYEPDVPRAPGHAGLVMVHGVHHLGMDEPRLVRFARSVARTGIVVLTPDVRELADYAVDERSVDTIGAAAAELQRRLVNERPALGVGAEAPAGVGVIGLSFAGGLALLAAAEPLYASAIGYVVSVGAHDDLARVLRFFATGRIEQADGSTLVMKPHDYGPLVLVYAHAGAFFPEGDVPAARETLRLWLWEEKGQAREREEALSPSSKAKIDLLFDGKIDAVATELLHDVDSRAADMEGVSPHNRLARVQVPVFLLHGASDNVIPASETLWIARDLPASTRRTVLVSGLIGHVEIEGTPPLRERWAAVHFMAEVLAEAEGR